MQEKKPFDVTNHSGTLCIKRLQCISIYLQPFQTSTMLNLHSHARILSRWPFPVLWLQNTTIITIASGNGYHGKAVFRYWLIKASQYYTRAFHYCTCGLSVNLVSLCHISINIFGNLLQPGKWPSMEYPNSCWKLQIVRNKSRLTKITTKTVLLKICATCYNTMNVMIIHVHVYSIHINNDIQHNIL